MKSLQVVGDSKYGGATYLILEWCKYLIDQSCKVDVLSTDKTTVSELRKLSGVRVVDSILIPREIELLSDLHAFVQLLSLLRENHYDIVHTYTATPGFLGRIAARLVGTPVILHHQAAWTVTDFSSTLERLLYTPLEYLATLASTKSVSVSHAIARQASQLHIAPNNKLVTICNGIEPWPFITAAQNGVGKRFRQELGIPADHMLIGNTGRLWPQKDNETLIRAMVHLKSHVTHIPFVLLLVGDGPDRQKLEDMAYSLGLGEQVKLLGFRRDIPAILAGFDIFVNPSLREGLSISILEAMASAKPIVTTSILPNAELIEHEVTGLLVNPRSPEQVALAISRFVNEPELAQKCGETARQRVLERYTLDRMVQETWDLYISLLQEK